MSKELSRAQYVGERAVGNDGVFVSHMFRRPEPVYDDIERHPFSSQNGIDTFPVELKDSYLRVFRHLKTGCDLEPVSEAVTQLYSEQQ